MKIRPSDNWRWYFDEQLDALMLDIANGMVFKSRYTSRMLTVDAFSCSPFTVSDATNYYHLYDSCAVLQLSEPLKVELILNAIVAGSYLKPLMPKSWYFTQQPRLFKPQKYEMVVASVHSTGECIRLLVIETGEKASLCLIAEPNVMIEGKNFVLADAVKVMNDRLASTNYDHYNEELEDNDDYSDIFHHVS